MKTVSQKYFERPVSDVCNHDPSAKKDRGIWSLPCERSEANLSTYYAKYMNMNKKMMAGMMAA
jgi:hypothetical protein